MKVRMIGSIRVKKTVASPWRSNQRSAHSRWLLLDEELVAVLLDQVHAAVVAHAVRDPGAHQVGDRSPPRPRQQGVLPSETLKPANSMVASLGTGMPALSRTISTKTPAGPSSATTSTATSTIGSVMEAMKGHEVPARVAARAVPLFATSLEPYLDRDRRRLPGGPLGPLHPRSRGGGVRARVRRVPGVRTAWGGERHRCADHRPARARRPQGERWWSRRSPSTRPRRPR